MAQETEIEITIRLTGQEAEFLRKEMTRVAEDLGRISSRCVMAGNIARQIRHELRMKKQ